MPSSQSLLAGGVQGSWPMRTKHAQAYKTQLSFLLFHDGLQFDFLLVIAFRPKAHAKLQRLRPNLIGLLCGLDQAGF